MNSSHIALLGLVVLVSLPIGPAPAAAQVRITGAISGTVTDDTGGVVPGATVQLKDEGTASIRQTVTNESGYFSFPDLNHGTYELTVSLQGFQTAVYNKVVVESSRTTDLRVRLQVGGVGETVTVEGANPVLETSSNVVSTTLNNKVVNELPLAGRDLFGFARLCGSRVERLRWDHCLRAVALIDT